MIGTSESDFYIRGGDRGGGWKLCYPTGKKTYQLNGHDGFVIVGQFVVHCHDHAVCHDGDDDDPVEGRPVDQPGHHLPHRAGWSEEEERGGTSLVRLVLLLLPHPELLADCRGLQDSEILLWSGQSRSIKTSLMVRRMRGRRW